MGPCAKDQIKITFFQLKLILWDGPKVPANVVKEETRGGGSRKQKFESEWKLCEGSTNVVIHTWGLLEAKRCEAC